MQLYQFSWMFEAQRQQCLVWQDAAQARLARIRTEHQAAAQLRAMLDANPSGQLGNAKLDDPDALSRSGLL